MAPSESSRKPLIRRAFSRVGRTITWLRNLVFNLVFLVILLIVIVAIFTPTSAPLPDKAPLLISPEGILVDQYTYIAPTDLILKPRSVNTRETRIADLIDVIHRAQDDDRITGLIIHLDRLTQGGLSKLQEVGRAVTEFKKSGKPVIAIADNYTQQQYFLASFADEIYLHDMGTIQLTGFGVYNFYMKEALDKLAVNFHVFRVGEYKDFVEPFTRKNMSEQSRENNTRWVEELWQSYTLQIERHRGLAPDTLNEFINDMQARLATTGGNFARYAQEQKLVDHVASRIQRNQILVDRFGPAEDEEKAAFNYIDYRDYVSADHSPKPMENGNVGLILARGTILDGTQPEGSIGGDSLAALIRKARKDDDLKAIVLRIDSGGGSAFASEIVRQELQATRDAGKPVVVSMGSVAASGGYWIAMGADEVWATPSTITGSIGVFGLLPTFNESLAKLGIYSDGIGTTELADTMRLDRPLSAEAQAVIQQSVETIYQRFLSLVADNRGKTVEELDKLAQGRIWTGARAHELGLVDNLGYLEDAIEAAGKRAGLDQPEAKLVERDLTPHDMLVRELLQKSGEAQSLTSGLTASGLERLAPLLAPLETLWRAPNVDVSGQTVQHAFALCLACLAP